ncbi:hypothetical protein [uncultured Pontibacter sp.]|uniref:hypothetical protein n=1 Tax=uncultured Pontibacter sp. TaxID=453356 RepID=UPI002609135E|nr:hypothetical protein [uncultured Pontibacter sp.]
MIASVVTAFIFLLFGLLFPHKPKPVKDYEKLLLVNEHKYKIYEIFSIVPLFFFTGLICYVFYLLGNDVQEVYFRGREAEFAIYPPDAFWVVPGICFGFGLIMPPIEFLYRLMLQEEYEVYMEYTNRKYGMDGYKVVRLMCMGCVVAGVGLSFLGLGWYKEIKGDKIVIADFYSLTLQEYTIQQIESVTYFEKNINSEGMAEVEPHYKITFSDGRTWDTSDNFHEVSEEKYEAIVNYLVSRSNLEVVYKDVDEVE